MPHHRPLADGDELNISSTVYYGSIESLPSEDDTAVPAYYTSSGLYQATYSVLRSGLYQLEVYLNDNPSDPANVIGDSPFLVDFSPNFTSPELTDVTGAGLEEAEVNVTNTLIVTSKDAFGNLQYYPNVTALGQQAVPNFHMVCTPVHPGQHCVPVSIAADNFTVRVVGPDGMDAYDEYGDRLWHGRINSYGDGTHALRYTPPYAGEYILEVNLALTTPGLTGEYYESMWLDRGGVEPVLTQVDSEIDFDWASAGENGPFVGAQYLGESQYVGVRWTGLIASE